jgi:methylmalonyl-CoA/ethylmalonyl-CoA epimerase
MPPIRINHIAVVVENVPAALNFWRDALGLHLNHTESNDGEEVEIAFLPVGDSEIELIAPTTEGSGVAKFLASRGPGLHHLCIEVDDIAASMEHLTANGAQLINESPRLREDGTRYAFVHPKSTGGVLVELYELAK